MLENFVLQYKEFLFPVAEITASTLELIGIIIIFIGSCYYIFAGTSTSNQVYSFRSYS